MADEDTTVSAENAPAAEESSAPALPAEQPTTSETPAPEGAAEEAQPNEPAAEAPQSEPERKPSRAERVIRKKDAEIKNLQGKVSSLEQNNQSVQSLQPPPQLQPNEAGEVTPQQLDEFVAQRARQEAGQQVGFAIAQERAKANFEHDVATLAQTYPEIESIPGMEERIAQEYQEKAFKVVGVDPATGHTQYALDPSVRLADVAKNYVDVARAAAKQSSAATNEAVAQSADTAAIPPSGSAPANKPISEMTVAELEARVGYHDA